jgi:2-amino-4-hydroxy-6-hydroxymethyldihydropteridine diphosphokinase
LRLQSFIALGGNLGTVEVVFRSALSDLDAIRDISVERVSSFYRTTPIGKAAGEAYLNAAAELRTKLSSLELLDALQAVESRHGRVRGEYWGPRTLDLDLLLHGDEVLDHPRLMLPHPGAWYRRFVLDPLAEIAPGIVHPVKQITIKELRQRLLDRPFSVGLAGGMHSDRQQVADDLAKQFSELQAAAWSLDSDDWPTLLLWLGTSTDQSLAFEDLPLLPRLDLTRFPEEPGLAAHHVVSAALG